MVDARTDPNPRALFGRNLRRLRKGLGVSQEELAFGAELDRTYVSSVERGHRNISIDNIFRLAYALQCDPRDLLAPDQEGRERGARARPAQQRRR
jgi:transcriptional regulator with XRE-family HTH domain